MRILISSLWCSTSVLWAHLYLMYLKCTHPWNDLGEIKLLKYNRQRRNRNFFKVSWVGTCVLVRWFEGSYFTAEASISLIIIIKLFSPPPPSFSNPIILGWSATPHSWSAPLQSHTEHAGVSQYLIKPPPSRLYINYCKMRASRGP